MQTTEIAWAAGFFDGEGTAYAARNAKGRRYLCLNVANSDREQLERFQAAIGGRIYATNERGERLGRKQMYMLRIARREDVRRAVDLLTPYLGRAKREAIEAASALEAANPSTEGYGFKIWETRRARHGPNGLRTKIVECGSAADESDRRRILGEQRASAALGE